jgi:hypothetical protein
MENPVLSEVHPASIRRRSTVTLILVGSNFDDHCSAVVDGTRSTTTEIAATQLRVHLSAKDVTTAGTVAIKVHNGKTGADSNPLSLTITSDDGKQDQHKINDPHNLPLLPLPTLDPADDSARGQKLDALFAAWGSGQDAYKVFIALACLAADSDPISDIAGDAEANQGTPVTYYPYPGSSVGIRFQYLRTLVETSPPNFFSADASRAVYVLSEGFTAPLNYNAAKLISDSVMAGLITRLVLQAYADRWSSLGTTINLSLGLSDYPLVQSIQNLSNRQVNPDAWKYNSAMWTGWFPKPTQNTDYDSYLALMTDACSCRATGMLMGWAAGDSIMALKEPAPCIALLWRLIGAEFTMLDIGVIVSYTLNFLIGFVRNERTVDIITGTIKPRDPLNSTSDVLAQLTNHIKLADSTDPLVQLTSRFGQLVVAELYGIVEKGWPGDIGPATDTGNALTQYTAFLDGFLRGSLIAAESVFSATFSCAYSIGYTQGFHDGYSQGYMAGYQAGYAAGYADGKSAWGGLTTVLQNLATTLTDTTAFLKEAGTVGAAITAISALF